MIPQCVECDAVWLPADEDDWQAHWVDDGTDERLVFYRGTRESLRRNYPFSLSGLRS
jgi:hypothetical protein